MKIGLFGLGYVGSAVAHTHRNHTLIIRDPKLGEKSATISEIKTCDAIYVCVPTPMLHDGHCDDSYIISVLKELEGYDKLIICKSTVPPGVYLRLQDRYPNIVHAPEFLTAANAVHDYETSTWVLIGGQKEFCQQAKDIISNSTIQATHYHITDIATASLFKYMANAFMATKVTFMNDLYHLANSVGANWTEIKEIAKNDPRLGTSHWDVPGPDGQFGYGGACFPKDVSAIVEHGLDIGTPQRLLESVNEINKVHRKLS
jgi:UDPglucose 6-dehydrogenase